MATFHEERGSRMHKLHCKLHVTQGADSEPCHAWTGMSPSPWKSHGGCVEVDSKFKPGRDLALQALM